MTTAFARQIVPFDATIDSGQTNSDKIDLEGYAWGSYQIPAAFTGTTVTLQYSNDGTNWTNVPTETGEDNPQTVATNGTYAFPARTFCARYARLVASSQAAARAIKCLFKG